MQKSKKNTGCEKEVLQKYQVNCLSKFIPVIWSKFIKLDNTDVTFNFDAITYFKEQARQFEKIQLSLLQIKLATIGWWLISVSAPFSLVLYLCLT